MEELQDEVNQMEGISLTIVQDEDERAMDTDGCAREKMECQGMAQEENDQRALRIQQHGDEMTTAPRRSELEGTAILSMAQDEIDQKTRRVHELENEVMLWENRHEALSRAQSTMATSATLMQSALDIGTRLISDATPLKDEEELLTESGKRRGRLRAAARRCPRRRGTGRLHLSWRRRPEARPAAATSTHFRLYSTPPVSRLG